MKTILSLLLAASLFTGCSTTQEKVVAPSVLNVRTNIQETSQSVEKAKAASIRSQSEIRKFKSHAEVIDFKATRALEILN